MDAFSTFAVLFLGSLIFASVANSQQGKGNSCIQGISLVDNRETITVKDAQDSTQTVQFMVKFRESCSEQQRKDEDVTIERLSLTSGEWLPLCKVDPASSPNVWCNCKETNNRDSFEWRCNFTDTFLSNRPKYKFTGNGFEKTFNVTAVKGDKTTTSPTKAESHVTSVIALTTKKIETPQTSEKQTTTPRTTTTNEAADLQVTLDLETDQSSQALTMVPFGVSVMAANGFVLFLVVVLFVYFKKRGKRTTSSDLARMLAELQHNGGDQTNPGPAQGRGRFRIYEEIPDGTSLPRPPRCGANRQGQVRQNNTTMPSTLPSVHFANTLTADVNYLYPPAPATNQQRAVGNRKSEAPPTSAKNRCQAPPTSGSGRSQSIAFPARSDWEAIPTPTREDGSGTSARRTIFRSESDPADTSLAVCTKEPKSEQSQSHAHVETEVMQIIAKLASVAAAKSSSAPPTIIPNSQPASPQHTYTGLRSSATPSARPESESTVPKFIYTAADTIATPTKEANSQSAISAQLALKEDQSQPLDLTLPRSSTKRQLSEDTSSKQEDQSVDFSSMIYDPNPASETFMKTVGDPATRPRAQNIYERSKMSQTSLRGGKGQAGSASGRPLPSVAAFQTPDSDRYLHPVATHLQEEPNRPEGHLDEDGFLRPDD